MRLTLRVFISALAALAVGAAPAEAGGFAIAQQGARSMGFGGAFTAQAADPSAIAHNAAGIAFLRGRQASVGGSWFRPTTTFTGSDPVPGAGATGSTERLALFPPAVFYTHQFSERIVLGAGFTRPFGLRNRWADPETFSGRFLGHQTDIDVYSINPTVAYRVADRLAVGVGIDMRRSTLALRRRFAALRPDTNAIVDGASVRVDARRDTAFGINAGVLARPFENLSLGAHYRSGVTHNYQGDAEFSLLPTGSADLDAAVADIIPAGALPFSSQVRFPHSVAFGAAYEWGDWTFAGDVGLFLWSRFQQIAVDFEGREDLREVVVQDYSDSMQIRVGAERRLGTAWAVRGGYFFDDSPAPAASLSPILFDADRHGLTLGGSWQQGPLRIDAAGGIVRSSPRSTGGTSREAFEGSYSTRAVTAGLSIGYAF
jgi:long-chain fatty acid transport protein